jgi:hypothetical protein
LSPLRWLSLVAGLAMIGVAAVAATRIANTRAGLIAEVIMLLAAVVGLVVLFYGLFARPGPSSKVRTQSSAANAPESKVRSANDLVLGTVGIVVAIVLLSGLAISGGLLWTTFGFILLSPMLAGSVYLSLRFLRAPNQDWRVDLRPLRDAARQKKHADHDQNRGPQDVSGDEPQVGDQKKETDHDEDQTHR